MRDNIGTNVWDKIGARQDWCGTGLMQDQTRVGQDWDRTGAGKNWCGTGMMRDN